MSMGSCVSLSPCPIVSTVRAMGELFENWKVKADERSEVSGVG